MKVYRIKLAFERQIEEIGGVIGIEVRWNGMKDTGAVEETTREEVGDRVWGCKDGGANVLGCVEGGGSIDREGR